MKNYLVLFFSFFFTNITLFAQEIKIKEGAYRNIIEFHKNKPFAEDIAVIFKPKPKPNIYNAYADKNKLSYRTLSFGTWGIYQDSTLYINIQQFGMGNGFAKILEFGRYSFFVGRVAKTGDQKHRELQNIFFYGLTGYVMSNYSITQELGRNDLYVIDLQNGMPDNIDANYMKMILRKDEELYNQYILENQESLEIMLFYLKELNKKLPIYEPN